MVSSVVIHCSLICHCADIASPHAVTSLCQSTVNFLYFYLGTSTQISSPLCFWFYTACLPSLLKMATFLLSLKFDLVLVFVYVFVCTLIDHQQLKIVHCTNEIVIAFYFLSHDTNCMSLNQEDLK